MSRNRMAGAAAKWAKNGAAAGSAWMDGVKSLTESPTVKAAAKQDQMLSGIQEAVASGRYKEACNRVTVGAFQAACQARQGNFTSSFTAKRGKYESYIRAAGPEIQRIQDEVNAMPDSSLAERLAKANTMATKMAELRGKYRQV